MRTAAAVLAAVAAVTVPLRAQSSTAELDANRLRCGIDSLDVYIVRQGSRRRTGSVIDECRVDGSGPARVLTRVYRATDAVLGDRVDTIVDVWGSLAPRSYHSRGSREAILLDWSKGRVRGRIHPNDSLSTRVDEAVDPQAYDGATFDLVLRASPLARDYSVDVPAYVAGRGVVRLTAKVAGEEAVDGEPAWRVDADFAGLPVTFWIAKTTRRLLKQDMHVAADTKIEIVAASPRKT